MNVELKSLKQGARMESAEGGGETAPVDDSQASSSLSGEQKGVRNRRSFVEMAQIRAADLEKLKKMDVSSWTQKKKDSCAASIELLTVKVAADATKLEQQALKRSKTGAARGSSTCASFTNEGHRDKTLDLYKKSHGL